MNGKVAKRMRRSVYGENFSPRERQYVRLKNGQIVNTGRRAAYQSLKKANRGKL